VITALPVATPVTTPALDTFATPALSVVKVIGRPVSTVPSAASVDAVSVAVAPGASATLSGASETPATGTGVTETVALPDLPPLVAVIVALPTDRPVTTPVGETVATVRLLELHVMEAPVTTAPLASTTVAVSATVAPT
jgi:hypothetical protein